MSRSRARPCETCGERSLYRLCHPCFGRERAARHHDTRRYADDQPAPAAELPVCTRCGSLNGRHTHTCPTNTGENPK